MNLLCDEYFFSPLNLFVHEICYQTHSAGFKVDLVRCKLNGDNPAHIMISDILENQHIIRDEKWLQAIKAIVQGDKENNARYGFIM